MKGAKPFPAKSYGQPASKEAMSKLSEEYLRIRNNHQHIKMLS
jgi:hypothetical protein